MPSEWRDADEKGYLSSWLPMVRDDDRPVNGFHGAFIPSVVESFVLRLTEPGDWVWDPLAGSGTSGRVCADLGRNCFQSDLTPRQCNISRCDARTASVGVKPILGVESGMGVVPVLKRGATGGPFFFDLIVLHPPYHSIVKFSGLKEDLSNCESVAKFLEGFSEVCTNVGRHLRPGGYLGLVIGDVWITRDMSARTGDPYGCYPLGFRCMEVALSSIPSILTAIQVKNIVGHARHRGKSTNLWKSRYFKWGSVSFDVEYLCSFRKEK